MTQLVFLQKCSVIGSHKRPQSCVFAITTDVDSGDYIHFNATSYKNALKVAEMAIEYVEAHSVANSSLHAIKSFAEAI